MTLKHNLDTLELKIDDLADAISDTTAIQDISIHQGMDDLQAELIAVKEELQQRKAEQLSKYVCYTEKGKQEIAIVSIDEVLGVEPHGK